MMLAAFQAPALDYHALAPELALTAGLIIALLVDVFSPENRKERVAYVASAGFLASLFFVLTLAISDVNTRSMFDGAYVVDNFALLMKAIFAITGYIVLLMSINYLEEGDYHEGEYSQLLMASVLGMMIMASARDLISIFVALELLSIPAYLLAGWRKRDARGNEAMVKYYLLGVLASSLMLYGMSLIFGVTGSTLLTDLNVGLAAATEGKELIAAGVFLVILGFAFKISAVPFHFWAPDTYEGAPTPITAFLSVASKTAGFVALINLVYIGLFSQADTWRPVFWLLAVLTMTVGNLVALKQTNIVRMLAFSSVAQAGFMLVPFAVADVSPIESFESIVVYLTIYAAMNLGAFCVVIVVSRKTRSGEIASFNGLFRTAPGLAVIMSIFLFSLAGIPIFAGWYAKFTVFTAAVSAGGAPNIALAVIAGINSAIALYYYANVARAMFFEELPEDDDRQGYRVPAPLGLALGACAILTVLFGVLPGIVADLAQSTTF
jgi:NADH-quinone oxidoreductase subunit N